MTSTVPTIDQNRLIDHLLSRFELKNDAALARTLDVAPPVISKVRHHRMLVGASLMIRILDKFDISLAEIRSQLEGAAA